MAIRKPTFKICAAPATYPLRARDGGVLKRAGHTEAAVDLSRMAGLHPLGSQVCEIQNPDGSMARLPQLAGIARSARPLLISIADLIRYQLKNERFVVREAEAKIPSEFGDFRAIGYRNILDGGEHVALVKGHPSRQSAPVMVRVRRNTSPVMPLARCAATTARSWKKQRCM